MARPSAWMASASEVLQDCSCRASQDPQMPTSGSRHLRRMQALPLRAPMEARAKASLVLRDGSRLPILSWIRQSTAIPTAAWRAGRRQVQVAAAPTEIRRPQFRTEMIKTPAVAAPATAAPEGRAAIVGTALSASAASVALPSHLLWTALLLAVAVVEVHATTRLPTTWPPVVAQVAASFSFAPGVSLEPPPSRPTAPTPTTHRPTMRAAAAVRAERWL